MPTFNRQVGKANVSGVTVIRLIPVSPSLNMNTIKTWEHLYRDEVWSVFNDVPSEGVYTFPHLNGSGQLLINDNEDDSYEYELTWKYPRNNLEQNRFHKLLKQFYFIAAVADGNGTFMVLGQIKQPFEVKWQFGTDSADYAYTATAKCTVPPLYVEGITNNFLYYGSNDLT